MQALEQGRKKKLLTKPESEKLSLDSGFLLVEELALLEKLPKEIEEFQVDMYKNRNNSQKVSSLQTLINRARKKQEQIQEKKLLFDSYTDEGFANQSRLFYLVHNSIFHQDELYDFTGSLNFDICLKYYIDSFIPSDSIREIARTVPWVNRWAGIKANGVIFSEGSNLSQAQELLLMWSSFYDSVSEAYEKPESFVIQNDDMLDGWLILQKDKDKGKDDSLISKNKRIQRAQEIYYIAHSEEDIKRINDMNSPESRAIKKKRDGLLQQKGKLRHMELPDIAEAYRKEVTAKLLETARKQNGTKR